MRKLRVAVDGPGSSGKGTVARGVARALGYRYVDTGAMYRAVALCASRAGLDLEDGAAVAALAGELSLDFRWDGEALQIIVDGEDLTRAIRADAIGQAASQVSRHPQVRAALLSLQRELAVSGGVVLDGRDIGTVVLPEAEVKLYLDASLEERARRRHEELVRRGEVVGLAQVQEALAARDSQDKQRAVAPLRVADDAVYLDTTEMAVPQVVEAVLVLIRDRAGRDDGVDMGAEPR